MGPRQSWREKHTLLCGTGQLYTVGCISRYSCLHNVHVDMERPQGQDSGLGGSGSWYAYGRDELRLVARLRPATDVLSFRLTPRLHTRAQRLWLDFAITSYSKRPFVRSSIQTNAVCLLLMTPRKYPSLTIASELTPLTWACSVRSAVLHVTPHVVAMLPTAMTHEPGNLETRPGPGMRKSRVSHVHHSVLRREQWIQ